MSGVFVRLVDPRLLGRHQIAAAVATATDFAAMIALVELAEVPPAIAAVLGAVVGGITNFAVSRLWAFHALHSGSLRSQALRYAMVSSGGALLNGALVHLALLFTPLPYVVARTIGSAVISVMYTYPLHARVVFRVLAPAVVVDRAMVEDEGEDSAMEGVG